MCRKDSKVLHVSYTILFLTTREQTIYKDLILATMLLDRAVAATVPLLLATTLGRMRLACLVLAKIQTMKL